MASELQMYIPASPGRGGSPGTVRRGPEWPTTTAPIAFAA